MSQGWPPGSVGKGWVMVFISHPSLRCHGGCPDQDGTSLQMGPARRSQLQQWAGGVSSGKIPPRLRQEKRRAHFCPALVLTLAKGKMRWTLWNANYLISANVGCFQESPCSFLKWNYFRKWPRSWKCGPLGGPRGPSQNPSALQRAWAAFLGGSAVPLTPCKQPSESLLNLENCASRMPWGLKDPSSAYNFWTFFIKDAGRLSDSASCSFHTSRIFFLDL